MIIIRGLTLLVNVTFSCLTGVCCITFSFKFSDSIYTVSCKKAIGISPKDVEEIHNQWE